MLFLYNITIKYHIKYIEEVSSERELLDEYGLLGKTFTPGETNTLLERTKVHVQNSINNNTEIRDKAMEYAESTIKGIAKGFGFENVEVNVAADNLIQNDEVEIKSVSE